MMRLAPFAVALLSTLVISSVAPAQTVLGAAEAVAQNAASATLSVGNTAPNFELKAVAGHLSGDVKLSEVNKSGPVVLVVLRGFPGYQCPLCSRQVAGLISQSKAFAAKGANVLMVYPGPAAGLDKKALQFLSSTKLPKSFTVLLDPDYQFTDAYKLRWNAPRETAYPSTFVIGVDGKVKFGKISKTHGGRSKPSEILAAL